MATTTYVRKILRLSLIHSIIGTPETAMVRLHIAGTSDAATHDLFDLVTPTDLGSIALNWSTFLLDTTGLYWANYSQLMLVKCALIGLNGHYENPLATEQDVSGSNFIGGVTNVLPESSVCISMSSPETIKKRGHGRMFLPHTQMTLAANSAVATTVTSEAVALGAGTFLTALNTIMDGYKTGAGVVITGKYDTTGGGYPLVTRVGCDGITDMQSRRQNRLSSTKEWQVVPVV